MKLDGEDYTAITGIVVAVRAGAFALQTRAARKSIDWGNRAIKVILVHMGQLADHAQWSHAAIRNIAEALHLDLGSAPGTSKPTISSPPPYGPTIQDLLEEVSTNHGDKK